MGPACVHGAADRQDRVPNAARLATLVPPVEAAHGKVLMQSLFITTCIFRGRGLLGCSTEQFPKEITNSLRSIVDNLKGTRMFPVQSTGKGRRQGRNRIGVASNRS